MDWKECIKKRFAKDVKKDEEIINSLLKTSENKLISSDELKISERTASSKVSLAYDSLRETLEVLAFKNRYKIYNHECYTAFLKEILNEQLIGEEFDELRKIRNSINYYGADVHPKEAEKIINRIKILREKVLNMSKNTKFSNKE